MARPPRDYTSFGSNTYFITASTWGNRSLFQTERMATLLIDVLLHYRSERRYLLHEFVVMPNHIHLLISPINIPIARAMQFIKGGFSYRAKKELDVNLEIWNAGMWSIGFGMRATTRTTSNIFGRIRLEPGW